MSSEAALEAEFLSLVNLTIGQSLTSHIDNERYCRNKARKARLDINRQDFNQKADKYQRLVDANRLISELINERILLGRTGYYNIQSGVAAPAAPIPRIANSNAPLVIPDSIQDLSTPNQYICPITTQIMTDPVLLTDGHVYEKKAIQQWLQTHNTSPITNVEVSKDILIPCFALKSLIEEYVQCNRAAT